MQFGKIHNFITIAVVSHRFHHIHSGFFRKIAKHRLKARHR